MGAAKGDPEETAKWSFFLTLIGVIIYFGVVYVFVLGTSIEDPEAGATGHAAEVGHHD